MAALCAAPPAFAQSTNGASGASNPSQDSDAPANSVALNSAQRGSAIEQVVVEAQRAPAALARKAQEEAPNLIVIQTYQEIRKLPDVTVSEAVRRVPGISLETDEGEGRYVNCRGFDADLNDTTFGGLRLPPTNNASPFGGYRAVTLDSIPIGLVGAITVTYSNLPDQDAEDLGCTIEITPKTAPPGTAPFIQGEVGTGYEMTSERPIIDVAVTTGGHFGGTADAGFFEDGPFSLVLTGSWYEDWRSFDDVEPAYFNDPLGSGGRPYQYISNIQQRDYELHRMRHSFGIDLGYQPNDNNSYYIRAFDAGYTESYHRQFLNLTPDGAGVNGAFVAPDGQFQDTLQTYLPAPFANFDTSIQKAFRDERETSIDRIAVAGGKNVFQNAVLDYRVGYTDGTYNKPYDVNSAFDYIGGGNPIINYNLNGAGNTPLYSISGANNYLNPANYVLDPSGSGLSNSTAYNFDKEFSAAANLELDGNWLGGDSEFLKIGASERIRHKKQTATPLYYNNLPLLPLTNATCGGPESYYDGQYQNGSDICPGYLQSIFGPGIAIPNDPAALQQFLDASEDVYAGYVEYNYTNGPFNVIGGVRIENTVDHTHAWCVGCVDSSGNVLPPYPVNAERNYVNVFPSVQAKYEIEPDLIARATYSSTLARPGFNQFTPATTFDLGSLTLTTGNPKLQPATANSFDASLEYYLESAGILSLGFFDKEIQNYIVPNALPGQTVSGIHDPVTLVTFTNGGAAYARGVEFNWQQRFTDLPKWVNGPEWLTGFGAGFNVTYVDSDVLLQRTNPITGNIYSDHSPLPSSSQWTWNADVSYEQGPLTLKLAAYSVSRDLFGVGSDPTSDIYNYTRTSMDFGSSYAWDDNLTLYFNVKNLLNTPHAFYEGSPNRPIQREFYNQTFQVGIRFDY